MKAALNDAVLKAESLAPIPPAEVKKTETVAAKAKKLAVALVAKKVIEAVVVNKIEEAAAKVKKMADALEAKKVKAAAKVNKIEEAADKVK